MMPEVVPFEKNIDDVHAGLAEGLFALKTGLGRGAAW